MIIKLITEQFVYNFPIHLAWMGLKKKHYPYRHVSQTGLNESGRFSIIRYLYAISIEINFKKELKMIYIFFLSLVIVVSAHWKTMYRIFFWLIWTNASRIAEKKHNYECNTQWSHNSNKKYIVYNIHFINVSVYKCILLKFRSSQKIDELKRVPLKITFLFLASPKTSLLSTLFL